MAKKKTVADKLADTPPAEEPSTPPAEENKRCFIITPIGDENSEVRRATDGLIDAVIEPVLRLCGLEALAPHRDYDPRSITRRIIENIVESRLVIANLTGLNPNVMYELAVRHAAGKPVVSIAERGTRLPFDIKDELTFFYSNDMQGSVELRTKLDAAIVSALGATSLDNPVVRYTQQALIELKGEAPDAAQLILDRLDTIERQVSSPIDMRNDLRGGHAEPHRMEAVRVDGPGVRAALELSRLIVSFGLSRRGVIVNHIETVPGCDDRVILRVSCPLGTSDLSLNGIVSDVLGELDLQIGRIEVGNQFF